MLYVVKFDLGRNILFSDLATGKLPMFLQVVLIKLTGWQKRGGLVEMKNGVWPTTEVGGR